MARTTTHAPALKVAAAGTVSVKTLRSGWAVTVIRRRGGEGDDECTGDCNVVVEVDPDPSKSVVYCQDDEDDPCQSPCECHLIETWKEKDKDKKGKKRKHRKDWGPVPKAKARPADPKHDYTCECHPKIAAK